MLPSFSLASSHSHGLTESRIAPLAPCCTPYKRPSPAKTTSIPHTCQPSVGSPGLSLPSPPRQRACVCLWMLCSIKRILTRGERGLGDAPWAALPARILACWVSGVLSVCARCFHAGLVSQQQPVSQRHQIQHSSALPGVDPRPANSPAGPQTVSHLKSTMNPAMFVPTRQTTLQEAFPTSLKLWFHAAFAQTGCQVSAPRLLFSFQTQEPSRRSLVPWF